VANRQLFRNYWRSFVALWLVPVPIAAIILFTHFVSEAVAGMIVPYLVAVIIVHMFSASFPPVALWRRGEITYWEMQELSAPIGLVAAVCFFSCVFAMD
jgi:hypothetical protein